MDRGSGAQLDFSDSLVVLIRLPDEIKRVIRTHAAERGNGSQITMANDCCCQQDKITTIALDMNLLSAAP